MKRDGRDRDGEGVGVCSLAGRGKAGEKVEQADSRRRVCKARPNEIPHIFMGSLRGNAHRVSAHACLWRGVRVGRKH